MMAAVVFLIGMVGVQTAMVQASQMNASALKQLRANAIASQLRVAAEALGYARLTSNTANGGLLSTARPCSAVADVMAAAGPIGVLPGACVIDIDALEGTPALQASPEAGWTVLDPGYGATTLPGLTASDKFFVSDGVTFRRVVVRFARANSAGTNDWEVAFVVAWNAGRTAQHAFIPDPAVLGGAAGGL